MSNLTEEEYQMLKIEEMEEINSFYDLQEQWERSPTKLRIEQELEELHRKINEAINWPEKEEWLK